MNGIQVKLLDSVTQFEAAQTHLLKVNTALEKTLQGSREEYNRAMTNATEGWAAATYWKLEFKNATADLKKQSDLFSSYKADAEQILVSRGCLDVAIASSCGRTLSAQSTSQFGNDHLRPVCV
jgi:hypothetical protein